MDQGQPQDDPRLTVSQAERQLQIIERQRYRAAVARDAAISKFGTDSPEHKAAQATEDALQAQEAEARLLVEDLKASTDTEQEDARRLRDQLVSRLNSLEVEYQQLKARFERLVAGSRAGAYTIGAKAARANEVVKLDEKLNALEAAKNEARLQVAQAEARLAQIQAHAQQQAAAVQTIAANKARLRLDNSLRQLATESNRRREDAVGLLRKRTAWAATAILAAIITIIAAGQNTSQASGAYDRAALVSGTVLVVAAFQHVLQATLNGIVELAVWSGQGLKHPSLVQQIVTIAKLAPLVLVIIELGLVLWAGANLAVALRIDVGGIPGIPESTTP